jgi:hypothetical protein
MLLVAAVLLGMVWAGGAAATAAGEPAGRLASSGAPVGLQAAALGDRGPALRPAVERPEPRVRALPLAILVVGLAAATARRATRPRSPVAGAGSIAGPGRRAARAPPHLQPA